MSSEDRGVPWCRARDIGLGGVFLETDRVLCAGDRYEMEIHLETPRRGPGHTVSGWAVRVEPGHGVAIEFTGMTVEFFDGLDRLLTAPRDLRWMDPPGPVPGDPRSGRSFEEGTRPRISNPPARSGAGQQSQARGSWAMEGRARALLGRVSRWASHRWRG